MKLLIQGKHLILVWSGVCGVGMDGGDNTIQYM